MGEKLKTLTAREWEVLRLAGGGRSNKQIARTLKIREKTVEGHLREVFGKLEVSSRAELLVFLHKRHLEP